MAHMVLLFLLEPPRHSMNAEEGVSVVAMAFNISKGIVAGWHFFPKSRKKEEHMQNIIMYKIQQRSKYLQKILASNIDIKYEKPTEVGEGILSLPAGIAAGTGIFTALLIMVAFYLVPLGRVMIAMVMLMIYEF